MKERSQIAADRWERFSASRPGLALMFAWAVAEATVWPVIPDALLLLMALGSRWAFPAVLAASIAGSALGGAALFGYAFAQPLAALAALPDLPTVSERTIQRAGDLLAERGPEAFWLQPVSGIPYKVVAILAAARKMDPQHVVPVSIFARTLRMAVVGVLAVALATRFRPFVRDHFLLLVGLYTALFGYGWWLTQR